MSAIMFI